MSGYRPEPDKPEGSSSMFAVKTFSFLLLAPALIGLFLLIEGLGAGGRVEAVIGGLLLASAPFVARWAWRGGMWN